MKVEVKLFATFREHLPPGHKESCVLELAEGARVVEVMETLRIPRDLPNMILLNGRQGAPESELHHGDVLSIFPPLAGGLVPQALPP
ncbi:MAG: MoaD/ThiS family protein [Deltaproteobacteria bacterium]|nr:MoaD/ThiS family protein [Deltaproteobacteria bacterium]MBI3078859.1 MoaD/ThiS family protein [Deltaproteobacteria bacterium]